MKSKSKIGVSDAVSYAFDTKYIDDEPYLSAHDILYMFKEMQEMLEVPLPNGGFYYLTAKDIALLESTLKESVVTNLQNYLNGN